MPINRFDTSIGQRYVSTYVPLPFEELAYIAKQHDDKNKAGLAMASELDAIGKAVKAAPMYEEHRQRFLKEINTSINDLVSSTSNYADPEFQRKALRLVNDFKSRPEINAFANTLKSYEDWEKIRQNRDAQRDLDFTYDKGEDGSFRQRDVLKEGVYTPNFTKYAESAKATEDIMKNIATDAGGYGEWDLSKGVKMEDKYHIAYNKKSGKWERLTDNKLKNVATINIPNYARTDAGLYRIREMLGSPDADYDTLRSMTKTPEGKKMYDAVTAELYKDLYNTGYKQLFGKSYTDQDIQVIADDNAKDAIKEQSNSQPIFASPVNTIPGAGIPDSFKKSGYGSTGTKEAGDRIGNMGGWLNLNLGDSKQGYNQPRTMEPKAKKFAEEAIKQLKPAYYEAYKKTGVLSDKMMEELYPLIDNMRNELEKEVLVGSYVQKLNDTELKQTKALFGSEKQQVKDLGSGLGVNAVYYIPSTGEKLTYSELKEKFPEESTVTTQGKYLASNPFVKLTGDKRFANGKQLSIDGTEIVVSGPDKFVDTNTGGRTKQDYELTRNIAINELYNSKFTPSVVNEIDLPREYGNTKVNTLYLKDQNNPDTGRYFLLDKNKQVVELFDSAEQMEDFIVRNPDLIKEINK